MTQEPASAVYARVDASDAESRRRLVAYLDGAAGHPAIQRIRLIADEALAAQPGQRVLDAGSGAGEVTRGLAGRVGPEGRVYGIDRSAALIEVAKERDSGNLVSYAVGDVTALDFPDGTFDAVRCERVLQHVEHPEQAVAELVRVTRPGGRVCLIDTDWQSLTFDGLPEDLVSRLIAAVGKVMAIRPTGRTLRRMLVQSGVTEVECHPVVLHFTDPADGQVVIPVFEPTMIGPMLPRDLSAEWQAAIQQAAARNELLAALTIWVVAGVHP